ncbi:DUF664 domain-containing protein [Solwaraspora sp. WMMD406]|nr:DUF664 domain-containing protein [Solwaraspora sp. WMMD406]MDG4764601.1 DUF664 domain-containing protein [Solwaraspora sp. WMMD406]
MAGKAAGTPDPQVRTAGVPSGTSLLGLIKHLAHVERFYSLGEPIADLRAALRPGPEETVEGLLADYRETIARANQVVDGWTDLAGPAPRPPGRGLPPTRRWVMVHHDRGDRAARRPRRHPARADRRFHRSLTNNQRLYR